MTILKTRIFREGLTQKFLLAALALTTLTPCFFACKNKTAGRINEVAAVVAADSTDEPEAASEGEAVFALLVSPASPRAGQPFSILAVGDKKVKKAKLVISGPSGDLTAFKSRSGDGLPYWKIDGFEPVKAGKYLVTLTEKNRVVSSLEFTVSDGKPVAQASGPIWKMLRSWDSESEALYSAWVSALFYEADERSSWTALHAVMQDGARNFLYNSLGLEEDNPASATRVIMEPDCADNPFFLRAYFAWKLGLPFGYHECDRGYIGKPPQTGRWVTNSSPTSRNNPVLSFNAFLRRLMDGVHSGTARTALSDESSDYYPVALTRTSLRPGVVFADPYGHTLILVKWVPQSGDRPGMLLSVDAQPDGTVAIKRFWKGNFLFTTSVVVGEPGFKAFRPISVVGGQMKLLNDKEIMAQPGMTPVSFQQNGMSGDVFYHTMERNINPRRLDPESAMLDLIQALHEQLIVRVTSVANGEEYMKSHPGEVIPMPGRPAGVFQSGGQWEDFSTPNRDLRLLIAMDAVQDFPGKVISNPEDYKLPALSSPEQVKKKLESLLARKATELSIAYKRSNGKEQILTLEDLLNRKAAFEMAYNPNDGIEIRWGAPENSEERSTCHRRVSAGQLEKMRAVRVWFQKRLHPPT